MSSDSSKDFEFPKKLDIDQLFNQLPQNYKDHSAQFYQDLVATSNHSNAKVVKLALPLQVNVDGVDKDVPRKVGMGIEKHAPR